MSILAFHMQSTLHAQYLTSVIMFLSLHALSYLFVRCSVATAAEIEWLWLHVDLSLFLCCSRLLGSPRLREEQRRSGGEHSRDAIWHQTSSYRQIWDVCTPFCSEDCNTRSALKMCVGIMPLDQGDILGLEKWSLNNQDK